MVLVVGSTGILGSEVCKLLAREGIPLRVMVRNRQAAEKIERLREYGAAVVLGNLEDPVSLAVACRGIHGIICTASALSTCQPGANDFQKVDLTGIANLIVAAEDAGVSRFIYPSFSSEIVTQSPLLDAKRSAEEMLRKSALMYTIIRASYFMETWFSPAVNFDLLGARAVIYGEGLNPIHWVSCRNAAQLIVHSLYNPDAYNTTLELTGLEALSPRQVVMLCEAAGKCEFQLTYTSEKALRAEWETTPDPLRRSWLGLFLDYAHGEGQAAPQPVAFPKRLISVEDYCTAFYAMRLKPVL
jgi:uncharacterized protein YbjT (DUF2867 family)